LYVLHAKLTLFEQISFFNPAGTYVALRGN
jgi:hypothetical protein